MDNADDGLLHLYLVQFSDWAVWAKLVRLSYLQRCNSIGLFVIDQFGKYPQPHEVEFNLPVICGNGKSYQVNRKLYLHINFGGWAATLTDRQLKNSIKVSCFYIERKTKQLNKYNRLNAVLIDVLRFYRFVMIRFNIHGIDTKGDNVFKLVELINLIDIYTLPLTGNVASAVGWDKIVRALRLTLECRLETLILNHIFIYAVPETRIIAVGFCQHYNCLEPYFSNLPFKIDIQYDNFEDIEFESLNSFDRILLFNDYDNETIAKFHKYTNGAILYTQNAVVEFIMLCNSRHYLKRFFLSAVTDDELRQLFADKNPSSVCVWGCGKLGLQLLKRFNLFGFNCKTTDIAIYKHGWTMPNGSVVSPWREIKDSISIVIVGVSGMYRNIAPLLDADVKVFAVNG
jgi:hypothetical protein